MISLIIEHITYGELVLFECLLCAKFYARTIIANERCGSDVTAKERNISQLIIKHFIIVSLKSLKIKYSRL